ncbi:MAG: replication initiation factor domain-containing protein, partial [bacterium]
FDCKKGHHGYKSQKAYDNIRIYSDGNTGMGIHVQMSGSGCRLFEETYKGTWKDFLLSINDANISRIDLAIDEKQGLLDLEKMAEKIKNKEVVTQFRSWTETNSGTFEFKNIGKTLYLGSVTSDIRFRIYDKAYETAHKWLMTLDENEIPRRELMRWSEENHWVRFELQFRDDLAQQIVSKIIENNDDNFFPLVAGVIKDKIRFVEPSESDINNRRWVESDFWLTFLEGVEKLKISVKPKKKDITDSLNHFEKQYAPTLATIFTYFEGDLDSILSIIYRGKKRMKSKHYELLNSVT